MIISIVNILLKDYIYDVNNLEFNFIIDKIDFYMKVPVGTFLITIIIVFIIIFISSKLSMRSFRKLNIIEIIKNANNIKIKQNILKTSRLLERVLGIEGTIGYKEIKRDKSKYNGVVISLMASIILFLGIIGFINICYKTEMLGAFINMDTEDRFTDCIFLFNEQSKANEFIDYLKSNDLINDYCLYDSIDKGSIKLTDDIISSDIKKVIEDGLYDINENGEIYIKSAIVCYENEAYNTLLKKIGIEGLNDNETIITNKIDGGAKYNEELKLTNYKEGDIYKVKIDGKEKELKIAKIVEDFKPYNVLGKASITSPEMIQMVNEKTFDELNKMQGYSSWAYELAVNTDKVAEIEKRMGEIEEIFEGDIYRQNNKAIGESTKAQKDITTIIITSFIGLLVLISAVNIFNTISSSILLRKRDFAVLKSMGMSNKQLNKMLIIEGFFYGINSIFFGTMFSVFLLFMIHMCLVNTVIYKFTIPWSNILICIIAIYILIFASIWYAKNKIKNNNMIDEIKDENI